jgi:hypothetical protein
MLRNYILNRFHAKSLTLGLSASKKYLAKQTGCKKQPDLFFISANVVASLKGKPSDLFPRTQDEERKAVRQQQREGSNISSPGGL